MLYKNTLVKIRKSIGRFLSLFIIMLVGVGFFAGLQASAPDITAALSRYNTGHHLTDFQIVSTMGLTDGDVTALQSLKDVSAVIPSYALDVLSSGKAIRVQAIEKSADTVELIAGRMPKTDGECVADSRSYKIGNTIAVSSDVSGKLKNTKFTVVGTVQSPLYLAYNYGNTTVGDGKLSSFIFVNRDNFTLDAYTEILVQAKGAENADTYSKEYEVLAANLNNEIVKLKPERETARYQEIYNKADGEIDASEATLNDQKASGEKQLADAKAQLDGNQAKLDAAKSALAQNAAELQKSIETQEASFQSAREQIADGRGQIDAALQNAGTTEAQLPDKINGLSAAIQALRQQQSQLPADSTQYAQLDAQIGQYDAAYQGLVQLQASIDTLNGQEGQLNQGIAAFNAKITSAKQQIADGQAQLAASQKELDTGYDEYNGNLAAFNAKIADAESKIQDARKKLADIDKPRWTILDRDSAVAGYSDVKAGTQTITSVAKLFPFFFILIVILMTSNTMARMIVEERGEIGTLASLGFKDRSIISTYLLYVLSATVLGTAIGFFAGCALIPKIIYACFPYILPPLKNEYGMATFALILAVAVTLMTAVTVFFCHQELKGKPADLMRPVPPKNGQTILLEKVGFVWRRLSFTWKVTLRNIFRYKQRVFMTIVGIAGCTALLLTGFGVRDSSNGVAQKQYGGIFRYDDLMVLKNETQRMGDDLKNLLATEGVQNPLLIRQSALTCEKGGESLDAYLVVPENVNGFSRYFKLTGTGTKTGLSLGDGGVIISQKLAEAYKIGKGGRLQVKDADNNTFTLPVTGVAENYIQNYVYMSKGLYSKIFSKSAAYNMVVSDDSGNENTLAEHLIGSNLVINVNFRDDMLKQAVEGNKSLNNVIVLLVIIAAVLMVIVLYNLTSINISEREREIATLKVLGFDDKEANEYIYREAFILTLFSIGAGLALGVGVHSLVMSIINENSPMLYFTKIKGPSFLWSFLIAIAVTFVMQVITYFKLKTVDMIQSLKSVE